ncbi:MAG: hypothetical protein QXR51_04730 [Desulfurococcaceae archaeon]
MDWPTVENKMNRKIRLLVVVSSVTSLLVSLLYFISVVSPLYYFHGYVEGYYSVSSYVLHYVHNQKLVSMPNTDYIKYVSLTFMFLSLILLFLSLTSIALIKQKPHTASGLAYGVALGLGVLYGLLNGYIYRAIESDLSRFSYLRGEVIVYKTLAGTIVLEGVKIEPTLVHKLLFVSPITLVLLIVTISTSTLAAGLTLYIFHKHMETEKTRKQLARINQFPAYTTLSLLSLTLLAAVFTYYPSTITINPQPPPATLETPLYTYTCTALARTSRGALTYTDFEAYPVPGWTSYGGAWGLSAGGGFKGNALRGRDNNGGVGRASQYYWNTRIDDYTSLWVSVKVRAEAGDGYKGIGLLNADRTRLYEISVYASIAAVWRWDGEWRLIGSTSVPGYSATRWYTLVLNYNVTATAVSFALWIYDDTGALVATLTASDTGATRFTPAYAGVTIDAATTLWFRFDDFIVSTVDPRSLYFTGFYTGMRVELWDNLGYLVNSTTAPSSSFALGVVGDVVVGTGSDGRIVVKYPDGYLCGELTVPATDSVLGGDTYALSTRSITPSLGANKTSAGLTLYISGASTFNTTARVLRVNASQVLYARLILDSYTAPATLNLDAWIEGTSSSTSIIIRSGVPVSTSTSIVQLSTGLGNSVYLSGYFTSTSQSAVLNFKLELCTMPGGMGACVYYPIVLNLSS